MLHLYINNNGDDNNIGIIVYHCVAANEQWLFDSNLPSKQKKNDSNLSQDHEPNNFLIVFTK